MKDKEKTQDEMISRRDMIKRTASYAVFTAVTMHVLAPKAHAEVSPPDPPPIGHHKAAVPSAFPATWSVGMEWG